MLNDLNLNSRESSSPKRYIVECYIEDGEYVPIKLRPDKTRPNSIRTVERTLQNIEENITLSELLDLSKKLGHTRYNHVFD